MPILSRPFDPLKTATVNAKLKGFTDTLVSEVEVLEMADGARRNKRSVGSRERFRLTLQALILDLYAARKTSSRLTLGVNLNRNWYNDNRKTLPKFLSYDSIAPVLKYLMDRRLGYIILAKKGFYPGVGTGKNTKIRASMKLIDRMETEVDLRLCQVRTSFSEDLIRLKDEKKKRIGYMETPKLKQMKQSLVRINIVLLRNWIDLELIENEARALQASNNRGITYIFMISVSLNISQVIVS